MNSVLGLRMCTAHAHSAVCRTPRTHTLALLGALLLVQMPSTKRTESMERCNSFSGCGVLRAAKRKAAAWKRISSLHTQNF